MSSEPPNKKQRVSADVTDHRAHDDAETEPWDGPGGDDTDDDAADAAIEKLLHDRIVDEIEEMRTLMMDGAIVVVSDGDEDRGKMVVALQNLAIILAAANAKIAENPYSMKMKSDIEELVLNAKMLESYYEAGQPEQTPPCSLDQLIDKFIFIKPMLMNMMG